MNPAWSVIFFTTVAGMAQGMVVTLALAQLAGMGLAAAFVSRALLAALAMLLFGLASSTFHLGHPERAWRAVMMWRTSWLSREVIVLPAFIAAVALWWWWGAQTGAAWLVLVIVLCVALWWCTSMIYACLRFIQEWAHPLTAAAFISIGLATGLVLTGALASAWGEAALARACAPWALAAVLVAWAVRSASLRRNARLKPKSTLHSATGLQGARVAQVSMGMTGGAFNTKEFFHHARALVLPRVKLTLQALLFAAPAALLLWAWASASPAAWMLAAAVQLPGLLAERWLFFAQARHPQNLYYQVVS